MKAILLASLVGLIAAPALAASPFDGTWVVSLGTVQPVSEVGKIAREQRVWNQLDLFTQLGIIPASAA